MTIRRAFIIKHAAISGMAESLKATFDNVDLGVLLQESGAVFFHLVCLSRLGTNDLYFSVTREKEYKYAKDPTASLASDSKMASTLCLFLALLVFGLPNMNVWFYLTSYLYPKETSATYTQKRTVTCFFVIAFYFAATALAWQFIIAISKNRQGSVLWVVSVDSDDYPDAPLNTNYLTELFEEMVSVLTLLVGVYYLAHDPQSTQVGFILKLTFLVAALFRAFPGSHFSPHISLYLALMKFTTWDSFWARCGGGFCGFGVACIWRQFRPPDAPAPAAGGYALMGVMAPPVMNPEAAFGGGARTVAGMHNISFDGSRYF